MGENEAHCCFVNVYFGNRAVLGYANKTEKNKITRINSLIIYSTKFKVFDWSIMSA